MRKKVLLSIMTIILALCSCFAIACNDKAPAGPSAPGVEKFLNFNQDSISVEEYTITKLAYQASGIEDELEFTSSASSVVTVDNEGRITAINAGTALITVKGDNKKDTMSVTVTESDKSRLDMVANYEVLAYENQVADLGLKFTYRVGEEFFVVDDMLETGKPQYTVDIVDGTVAQYVNGGIKGLKLGSTTATITGSFEGVTKTATVAIEVTEKIDLYIESETGEETIYISAGTHGQNAATSHELVYDLKINDLASLITLEKADYAIGKIKENGAYDKNDKKSISTKEFFKAEEFNAIIDNSNETKVEYEIFFYDANKTFLSSSGKLTADYSTLPAGAVYLKVAITPLNQDAEFKITSTTIKDYVGLVTVNITPHLYNIDITVDNDIVEIEDNYLVKANKVGEAVVKVKIETAKGTIKEKAIDFKVKKPVAEISLAASKVYLNRAEAKDLNVVIPNTDDFDEITRLTFDGAMVNTEKYDVNDHNVKLLSSAIANSYNEDDNVFTYVHDVSIYAENAVEVFSYTTKLTAYDMAIGSKAELNELHRQMREEDLKARNVILTDDINMEGQLVEGNGSGSSTFRGVFDGAGHTIYDLKTHHGFFRKLSYATIKNVAIVKTEQIENSQAAILFWENGGVSTLIENVYLQGIITGAHSNGTEYRAGIGCGLKGATLKNVIVDVEFTVDNLGYAISAHGSDKSSAMDHVYGISSNAQKYANAETEGETKKLFRNSKEFKAITTDIKSKFDSKYWDTDEGVVMFTSAKQYLGLVDNTNYAFVVPDFVKDGDTTYVLVNEEGIELKTNARKDSFELVGTAVNGITLENGVLKVADSVPANTKFSLKATAIAPFTGKDISTTIELTVPEITAVKAGVKALGKNRANDSISIKVANSLSNPVIIAALMDMTDINSYVEISGANVVIADNEELAVSNGTKDLLIVIKDGADFYKISGGINIADYAIGNETEFAAWYSAVDATTAVGSSGDDRKIATAHYFAALTDNINLTGTYGASSANNAYAAGELDGCGYTINNLKTSGTLFGASARKSTENKQAAGYVIKNIAFTNMTMASGYIFGLAWGSPILENVYLDLTITSNGSALGILNVCGNLTLKNVVFKANYGNKTTVPVFRSSAPVVDNVIVISDQPYWTGTSTETGGATWYKNTVEANAESGANLAKFDADIWCVNDTALMFKSTKDEGYYVKNTAVSAEIKNFEKSGSFYELYPDGEYTLTADKAGATFALAEAVDGVNITGNVLTIAETVAHSTEFAIEVSYIDPIYANVATTTITVRVKQVEVIDYTGEKLIIGHNRTAKLQVEVASDEIGAIETATLNNADVKSAITLTANKDLEIDPTKLAVGDGELVVVFTGVDCVYQITVPMWVADYAIANETEFEAWYNAVKVVTGSGSNSATKIYYAVLTDNVSLTKTYGGGGYAAGGFDGRGFTVDGLKSSGDLFAKACRTVDSDIETAYYVRNVAFTNAHFTSGYFFNGAQPFYFDNVYLDLVNDSVGNTVGLINDSGVATLTNMVYKVAYANQTNVAVFRNRALKLAENLIVISPQPYFAGTNPNFTGAPEGATWYKTQAEANAASTANLAKFDPNIWCVNDGVLMFKSTRDEGIYTKKTTITIGVQSVDKTGEYYELLPGEYTLTTDYKEDYKATIFALANSVEGITLVDNKLTIADTVAGATEFVVNTTANDRIYGQAINGTITIRVKAVEVVEYAGDKLVAGNNRTSKLTVELSSYNFTKIESATFNNQDAKTAVALSSEKDLEIDPSKLVLGDSNLVVRFAGEDCLYQLTIPVWAVDYAIGDADEFMAWYNAVSVVSYNSSGRKASAAYYAVLTDNVDLSAKTFALPADDLGYLAGELDGRGFTIANISYSGDRLFEGVATDPNNSSKTFTMRNVAWVNINCSGANMMFGIPYKEMYIYNSYIDFTQTGVGNSNAFSLSNTSSQLYIYDSIIKIEHDSTHSLSAMFRNGMPVLDNVILVSSQAKYYYSSSDLFGYDKVATGSVHYATQVEANAKATENLEKYDKNTWCVNDGALMFISTRDEGYYAKTTTMTAGLDGVAKEGSFYEVYAGEYTLTAGYAGATFALATAVDGVTVSGNKLIISDSVDGATEIVINATAYDRIYATSINQTITIRVKGVEIIPYSGNDIVVGLNRNSSPSPVSYSLTSYSIDSIESATFNDTDVTEAVSFAEGMLSIDPVKLGKGSYDLVLYLKGGNETYNLIIPVSIADYAIANIEEARAWLAATKVATASSLAIYAVLENNIEFTSEDVISTANEAKTGYLSGGLDGRGYSMLGLTAGYSGIWNMSGDFTFKNIKISFTATGSGSWVNTVTYDGITAGCKLKFENCHLILDNKKVGGSASNLGLLGARYKDDEVQLKDCFVEATYATTAALVFAGDPDMQNTIVVCSTGNKINFTGDASYADTTAVANAGLNLAGYDAKYWDVSSGCPVFKTKTNA